jgi:hypothetical protein
MKPTSILLLTATMLIAALWLHAQSQPTPAPTAVPIAYEPLPTLNASDILQPQYLKGPNFTVRNPVPTYFGSNHYTIDSDFGVFEADGNQMLTDNGSGPRHTRRERHDQSASRPAAMKA